MNKHSAQRKAIGLLDFVARIANSWLDENQKHLLVNYLNSKLENRESNYVKPTQQNVRSTVR